METTGSLDRRTFLLAGLGAAAATGFAGTAQAAEPTATERANMQLVKDFCAAWPSNRVMQFAEQNSCKIYSRSGDSVSHARAVRRCSLAWLMRFSFLQ